MDIVNQSSTTQGSRNANNMSHGNNSVTRHPQQQMSHSSIPKQRLKSANANKGRRANQLLFHDTPLDRLANHFAPRRATPNKCSVDLQRFR